MLALNTARWDVYQIKSESESSFKLIKRFDKEADALNHLGKLRYSFPQRFVIVCNPFGDRITEEDKNKLIQNELQKQTVLLERGSSRK